MSNGLLDNMAVTPRMWWLDVACSNHLMLAVELYENLPSARQKVRATHSSTHPWPAHVHALTAKSSLSWPPQQSDGGVKFVPYIWRTCIQYSTGYRSIAQTALVAIQVAKVENQIAKLLTKVLSQAKNRPGPPARVGEPSYPLKV